MTFKSGEIFAEHYQLIKCLGAGSFGEVWLARNLMTDINMAIKFYNGLDHNGINDFKEEFKLAYRLSHPNLLHLNHFDVYEQCPYLVMPYCVNGSAIQLRGNVSERRVWEFIRDVSAGLAYLHSQNPPIIHQDIKLGNILIDENDRFIVTDFGISKKIEFHMQTLRNIKMESSGTIAYMSPERLKTPPVIVMAGDMWSLGMSVYELITGQVLWELGGLMQLGGAEVPSLGSNYSSRLIRFFQRCLAQNPWERPKAQEAYEEAKAQLNGGVYYSRSVSPSVPISATPSTQDSSLSQSWNHTSDKRISYSSNKRNDDRKYETTWKEKYGSVVKWGGGAVVLFVLALGFFSLLFSNNDNHKKANFPFRGGPNEPIDPISPDTPAVSPFPTPSPIPPPYKPVPKPQPAPPKPVVNKEDEFWKRCIKEDNVFWYNRYLNEYSKGKYVKEAKKRIRLLENP